MHERVNLRSPPACRHFAQAICKVDINYFGAREQFVPVITDYSFDKKLQWKGKSETRTQCRTQDVL